MFEWLTALFNAITGVSKAVEKVIPSDKIREEQFEIKKPRLTSKEKTKMYDTAFRHLRTHPEIEIRTHVGFVYDNLDIEDSEELITLLTNRLNNDYIYKRKKAKL